MLRHTEPLNQLRASASDIVSACREARAAYVSAEDHERMVRMLDASAEEVAAVQARVIAGLERLGKRRKSAGHHFRVVQTTLGTLRTPNKPNVLKTLQLIVLFWMLETVLAGGVMIAGGKLDVAAGLAYAGIYALITVILGLALGFLALRYLNYRQPHDIFDAEG